MTEDASLIELHTSEAELRQQMRATDDVARFQRLGFLLNLAQGDSVTEAITREGRSPSTGYRWKAAWRDGGIDAMMPETSSGRPPKLRDDDWETFRQQVRERQPCSTQQLCQLLRAEFNVIYNEAYLERILPNHEFAYTTPALTVASQEGTLDAIEWDRKQHPETTERHAYDTQSRRPIANWTVVEET